MKRATIIGSGLYVPEHVVTNADLNKRYGRDVDTFLREKRNIYERRFMSEDQAVSDLILPAAEQALKRAGITANDLDLIILSTDTPDYISPPTAPVVQYKLGATKAGCFDINSACAGVVTAIDIAAQYLTASDRYRYILVCGAYGMTKFLNWDDHRVATLFGDGAGAVVMTTTSKPDLGVLAAEYFTDGQYHDSLGLYVGGTRKPITKEAIDRKEHLLHFEKRFGTEFNVAHWSQLANTLLERTHKRVEDVKYFFFTQLNLETIEATMQKLGAPQEKAYKIMDHFGYTGNACIAMAFAHATEKHLLKEGDLIISVTSGGGVTMASMAMRWSYNT